MEKDEKKNKNRIVSFDEAIRNNRPEDEEDDVYAKKVKRHRVLNRLGISLLFALVAAIMIYLLLVRRSESYTAVGFEWEQAVNTSANQKYINFNGGILQYGPQGANYYTAEEKDVWAAGYSMKNPSAISQDGYALIYDQGDKTAVILSAETGLVGNISTEEIITKGTVSAFGAVALITEESMSNTICFFDSTGKRLDINIHTIVDQSGYPVDIAFSPDGQMMMASFVFMDSGVMQNQIVFYNFDEKRSTTGVVGAFRKYDDILFADVAFLNDDRAVAFGDGRVVFYSLKNKTAPEELKEIEFDKKITQVAYSGSGVAIATENGEISDNHIINLYSVNGDELFSQEKSFTIKSMLVSENGLYIVGQNAMCYMNFKGKSFFSGSLECDIIKLNNSGEENDLLLITNQKIVHLKLFRG